MRKRDVKVLLIEDNPGDVRLIREWLSESDDAAFQVDAIPRLSMGLSKLDEAQQGGDVDLVLLDLQLPDSAPDNSLNMTLSRAQDTPVIVFSALEDEEMAMEALEQGAQDYLAKGSVEGNELVRTLLMTLDRFQDVRSGQSEGSLLRTLLAANDEPALLVDREGIVREANAAVERLFGVPPDELTGQVLSYASGTDGGDQVEVFVPPDRWTPCRMTASPLTWQGEEAKLVILDPTKVGEGSEARLEDLALRLNVDARDMIRSLRGHLEVLRFRHGDDLPGDARAYLHHAMEDAEEMEGLVDALSRIVRGEDPQASAAGEGPLRPELQGA